MFITKSIVIFGNVRDARSLAWRSNWKKFISLKQKFVYIPISKEWCYRDQVFPQLIEAIELFK